MRRAAVGLLERVSAARAEKRYSADTWVNDFLLPSSFNFGGNSYGYGLTSSYPAQRVSEISATLPGYSAALRGSPPAFAAQMVRALVLSQARFTFRTRASSNSPRKTFGTRELGVLERPWTNATTGELIARMEWHAGLAGNSYVVRQRGMRDRLRVLRPDWVAIIYGSQQEPEDAAYALDGEVIGYVYANGGLTATGNGMPTGMRYRAQTLLPDEVAHWSPLPDPEGSGIGMSWLTPAIRDLQADQAATAHKVQFFKQSATPNLVIKGLPATTKAQFDQLVEMMEERHAGVANAFRTLYLTAGADATVIGSNFKDMDLKNIQGASETRISSLSRVPAPILGIAEGLAGSSLNAGNFGMARRIFADSWVYPSLQDLSASLSPLLTVPSDAELWFDTADMPLLREDAKDAADIEDIKATTITKYVREGFTAESSIAAVRAQDITLLKHTGKVSVQLQEPGAEPTPAIAGS
jgi:phage portal protein BeeE